MADTIYLNGVYCKKKNYGIGISGKASDLIAEIQKHTNNKGYIRLELKERKEADKNGNTHYLIVDTYEPQQQQGFQANNKPAQKTYSQPAYMAGSGNTDAMDTPHGKYDDDLPF